MGELEKVGNYEIIQSIRLGGRVMLLGYNPQDKEATYMTCYQHFNLMGEKTYPLAVASENYLEIMQEFLKRIQEQQQEAVAFREKRNVPIEMLGEEHCRQRGEDESLEGKLVIIAPASLAAEYRTADCQLGFAVGGFGCTPTARGRAVYFQELYSGERCRWDSTDILGIADVSKLPDWAKKKLKEYERTQPKKNKGGHEQAQKGHRIHQAHTPELLSFQLCIFHRFTFKVKHYKLFIFQIDIQQFALVGRICIPR